MREIAMHCNIFEKIGVIYAYSISEERPFFEVLMQPIGIKVLIQRDESGEFDLRIPAWIGERLGDLLLMQYDGNRLTISPANEFN
ncbi:hypothetical protein [Methanothrix sp.]|uniref:hypothetical protein n=1 Tax=Methanothrix sp. TaxID=90426 RepID=UPI003BB50520